ncbi:transposase [Spirosoma endophyticum]|uniref:Transposase DDE domain-containing protein n=1 Tax=Spirosoma endophyticum TaxID=662367 RepID=A0A1I1N3E4_9BACT|nr:transposase [Spirosoma endophyticum]SFC90008.1 Transposase DDE domain-containing protein [Spirosoma endophyticum]
MQSCSCFVPVASGEIYPTTTHIGKPFTTTAPAARFDQWKTDGTLERINRALNQPDRKQEEREALPSVFCIDSQSIKLGPMICEYRGLDPHKKVNGRKRQLLVDTGGRLWAAHVHPANEADGPAALVLVSDILWYGDRVETVFGDGSYRGVFAKALADWGINFERAARPQSAQGFVPVAKRWVVERTIAWTSFFRRIVKDYEYTLSSSVGWLILANIQLMLQRIKPTDRI